MVDLPSESSSKPIVKSQSKNKKVSKHARSYPTQFMMVGGLYCLFLKCYKNGRTPIANIGPNYHFLPVLIIFAVVATSYFVFMMGMIKSTSIWLKAGVYFLIGVNLTFLFGGMVANPGVAQSIFDLKLKEKMGKTDVEEDDEESSSRQPSDDLESVSELRQRSSQTLSNVATSKRNFCQKCQVFKEEDTYHCEDCDVCIYGYDHHCVFFSKCIGGGNIICFWGSIAMIIVVFIAFGVLAVTDAVVKNQK